MTDHTRLAVLVIEGDPEAGLERLARTAIRLGPPELLDVVPAPPGAWMQLACHHGAMVIYHLFEDAPRVSTPMPCRTLVWSEPCWAIFYPGGPTGE